MGVLISINGLKATLVHAGIFEEFLDKCRTGAVSSVVDRWIRDHEKIKDRYLIPHFNPCTLRIVRKEHGVSAKAGGARLTKTGPGARGKNINIMGTVRKEPHEYKFQPLPKDPKERLK